MNAAAGEADYHVVFVEAASVEDAAERDVTNGGADEIEAEPQARALDDVGELGGLAADQRDAGAARTFGEPHRESLQHHRIGPLDRDVVDHRDRKGADADQVVHVHGDAIDADGVVAADQLRDQRLGAHPVGGDGDAHPADFHDVSKMIEVSQRHLVVPGGADMGQHHLEGAVGPFRIDPDLL